MRLFQYISKHTFLFILLLTLIGTIIRVNDLSNTPRGFHDDEAYIGYNAYSLLKTAHDKNGVFLPLAINEFGDYRPAGLHYLTIPSVAIFGLNEFATRLPAALFGGATILLIYFLTLEIFHKKAVAIISSFILTFNPWHIVISRATSESVIALFFVLLGVLFILKSFSALNKQRLLLFAGFFSLFVSFLFYHAARYFVPFLILYLSVYVFVYFKKTRIVFLGLAIVLILSLGALIKFSSGAGRLTQISIFSSPATDIALWQRQTDDAGQKILVTRFFYNKLSGYTYTALVNYGRHFSPNFLFFQGGLPARYSVPQAGVFYPINAPFFIIGLALLVSSAFSKEKRKALLVLPVWWLFLGPLPAAFTFEDIPNVQRSIMMLPAFIWINAFGCEALWNLLRRNARIIVFGLIGLLFAYELLSFFHNYYLHTEKHGPWYRNENEKLLVMAIDHYSKTYRHIIMTNNHGNLLIYYLFYNAANPTYFQSLHIPTQNNAAAFKNMQFVNTGCPSYNPKIQVGTLVVDVSDCIVTSNYKLLQTIYYPDQTKDFYILKKINNAKVVPMISTLN